MDFWKVCGIAILCCAAIWILRQWKAEMVFPVRAVGTLLIFSMLIAAASPLLGLVDRLSDLGEGFAFGEILLRGLGISVLCTLGAGLCRDFGETGLAQAVETAGKVGVLLQALPLIEKILEMTRELLQA